MKKSQVLAALALAFALGVVAPVAGVVNTTSVSAYSDETGTATLKDVNNSIAFIENNATYKAFLKIRNANSAYTTGVNNGAIADLAGDGTYATDAANIYNVMNSANSVFGYNIASFANEAAKTHNYKAQIEVYIKGAKTSSLYNAFAGVLDVINNNSATDGQLQAAATKVRTTVGWTDGNTTVGLGLLSKAEYDNLHPEQATLAVYRSANSPYATWGTYSDAKAIYDAVDTAEGNLNKYNSGYNLYMPLLVESGLFSEGTIESINDNNNVQPSFLNGIATSAIIRQSAWASLYDAVQSAKTQRVQENSGDNYSIIGNLATAWKAASGNEQAQKVVMAMMAAYTAPIDNNNGTGDNQNGGNKAPDTGVLAGEEGSASTTVAMVAGVATALTAAGAGVVAYRNARRSTRK